MIEVRIRFYEELNDFLTAANRRQEIGYRLRQNETVKHAIEACGVPHAEVELILVNGESVDFGYRMKPGDRVSVYPQFECFDISPLLKVRPRPLRNPRFVADVHLGGLAKYLRMLGFDTLYSRTFSDDGIAALSTRDRRIVLTRDRDLLMHRAITRGRYVRARNVHDQVIEVVSQLDLSGSIRPFSRCMECNTGLVSVNRDDIRDRLPEGMAERYARFSLCPGCDRAYWEGSHYRRMQKFITENIAVGRSEPVTG